MARIRVRAWAAVVAATALVVAGCGEATPPRDDGAGSGAIVSLSPTATEMLYAVGAGDQVVAVDDQSDYPEQAPRTDLSGYTPNLEAILAHDPDLVVLSDDNNDVVAGLERVGVEVLQVPAATNLDETYAQIEQVGAATGHADEAKEVTASMRADIAEVLRSVPHRDTPLTYYHELDDTFYSITDDTYLGQIYGLVGLTSIAHGGDGYPQLSAEYIIDQDPQLIFLADSQCCAITPEKVADRAGWGDLRAVADGQVHVRDEDVASRWGPRVVDLVRQLAGIASEIPASGVRARPNP